MIPKRPSIFLDGRSDKNLKKVTFWKSLTLRWSISLKHLRKLIFVTDTFWDESYNLIITFCQIFYLLGSICFLNIGARGNCKQNCYWIRPFIVRTMPCPFQSMDKLLLWNIHGDNVHNICFTELQAFILQCKNKEYLLVLYDAWRHVI